MPPSCLLQSRQDLQPGNADLRQRQWRLTIIVAESEYTSRHNMMSAQCETDAVMGVQTAPAYSIKRKKSRRGLAGTPQAAHHFHETFSNASVPLQKWRLVRRGIVTSQPSVSSDQLPHDQQLGGSYPSTSVADWPATPCTGGPRMCTKHRAQHD